MRIPLNQDLKSRDGTLTRDGLIRNASATNTQSGVKLDKRAGTYDSGVFVVSGTPSGVFAYNDIVYSWNGGNTAFTPEYWSIPASMPLFVSATYEYSGNAEYMVVETSNSHGLIDGDYIQYA